ncbi:hypothetical protein FGW20_07090 [Methanoculleus sp. FWC-SCC3]|uniref:Gram-positive cocci surface proteins LPxTG domain-containing protein n=1 Tax=Methanoculleus methanifontis TaxID=2584086 RepID=A0ABT8M1A1_9EURY|nr:hypothetical protein [Methanoculleus sp. FWC-SCC3]MDN7012808.1 hypothetical protein [Methanoculleus sp. FWC-SCC3]
MTGNLWVWRALLVVLLVAVAGVVFPAAAQDTTPTEPLTWTLPPTPGETPEETLTEETPDETPEETLDDEAPETTLDETPEETLDDETPETTLDETPEETLVGVMENETPEETLTGAVENETAEETLAETSKNTTNETAPPVVVEPDETTPETTPVDTSTAELPTFTPIQAAQVNGSTTQVAPTSLAGAILAVLVAGLVVAFGRNRR